MAGLRPRIPRTIRSAAALPIACLLAACATTPPPPGAAAADDAARSPLACALPSNCVTSLGDGGLPPLRYQGTPEQAIARLQATLAGFPEASVVRTEPLAIAAVFTTPAGFKDLVDFRVDPNSRRIDYRSRSSFGLFDFGKNRSRMQAFAQRFDALAPP